MNRLAAAVLLFALATCGRAQEIIYGTQIYPGGVMASIARSPEGSPARPVGAQINGWSFGTGETWGIATEAIAFGPSTSILVGLENLVVNANAANFSRKIANNAVISCSYGSAPCTGPNNFDSIAYWVSAYPGTGFGSAFKLDRNSIADFPGHRATVIDLGDLDPARNGDVVLFRLPGGREVTVAEFIRALDKP